MAAWHGYASGYGIVTLKDSDSGWMEMYSVSSKVTKA